MNSDDSFKVFGVGVTGLVATSIDWLFIHVGPVLDIFVRLGQIGVAAVSILYIYSKWRAVKASHKDDNEDPS